MAIHNSDTMQRCLWVKREVLKILIFIYLVILHLIYLFIYLIYLFFYTTYYSCEDEFIFYSRHNNHDIIYKSTQNYTELISVWSERCVDDAFACRICMSLMPHAVVSRVASAVSDHYIYTKQYSNCNDTHKHTHDIHYSSGSLVNASAICFSPLI